MKRLNQSGSHVVALMLLVLVLGVVGFTGYKVQQSHHKVVSDQATSATPATVPKTIANTTDLQDVNQVLDQSSPQLNNGLDDSQLNADLNSML